MYVGSNFSHNFLSALFAQEVHVLSLGKEDLPLS